MSSTLMWQPVDMNKKALSDELKHALQKRDEFNGPEGRMDESSISYLKGLRDAGIKESENE